MIMLSRIRRRENMITFRRGLAAPEMVIAAGGAADRFEGFDRRRNGVHPELPAALALGAYVDPDARVHFRRIERTLPSLAGKARSGRRQFIKLAGRTQDRCPGIAVEGGVKRGGG